MVEPEAEVVYAPEGVLRDRGAQTDGDALRSWIRERVRVRVDEAGKDGIGGEIGDGNACRSGVGNRLNSILFFIAGPRRKNWALSLRTLPRSLPTCTPAWGTVRSVMSITTIGFAACNTGCVPRPRTRT